ncbi:flagellar motor protein MotB [Aquirufa sp.]|jgi:chemotaxis protein MotB|uniref:flagellar motor protein MotB n=1 Tax=Aquirufa sp. TaxID=2676249 RepID=UPI0037BE30C1
MKKLLLVLAMMPFFFSCSSKKKMAELQSRLTELQTSSDQAVSRAKSDLADCQSLTASLQGEIKKRDADLESRTAALKSIQEQLDYMKKTNTNLLDRLSDLSVINKSGAESIRKSLDALNEQGKYIKDLNSSIQKKDSVNLSLVMNLKRSLADINDEDVTVEVKKGVVYISISDKLMFASGSANVNSKAETVLAKVAKVVNDHKELDILVEGHTDAVPISTPEFKDNWDLSAKRATSVVRLLQSKFGVDPERMTAGGRGEFVPQSGNNSRAGRKQNRRTEIIVTPKLDQFFNLMAPPTSGN